MNEKYYGGLFRCEPCNKVTVQHVTETDTSDDYQDSTEYFVECDVCGDKNHYNEDEFRKAIDF